MRSKTQKSKSMNRKRRFYQFALIFLSCVGTILSQGNMWTAVSILGAIMVIVGAVFWTFQDDADWEGYL